MRVLLVEDNPELVKLLVKGLAQGGFSADSVGTVGDARHVLSTMKFTAVVLDLGLPDEDGLALLRDMRRKGDSTPVLVLTARDGVTDRVTGLREGADDYLAKPFAMEELVARLQALLRRPGNLLGKLLSPEPLGVLLSCHTPELTPISLHHLLLQQNHRKMFPIRKYRLVKILL